MPNNYTACECAGCVLSESRRYTNKELKLDSVVTVLPLSDTLGDYTKFVKNCINPSIVNQPQQTLTNACMGMAGEVGEAVDHVKKHLFHGHALNRKEMLLELGDVLFYVVMACISLDVKVEDVINGNVAKLKDRYPNGFSVERSINRKAE